eukprot:CAMPEP_0185744666 /NCGR_PEP_ID=MMETSP1174-20130828/2808_1 /TAXON_ID=35687 /ORGANISM="Dictyocha speculum, Strain CCMP1381" /LENGTH=110 /DNA_ID=CAMNT_0028418187 /DNA_START=124 /DNA_END=456 /DNA_ORIENTATION=+
MATSYYHHLNLGLVVLTPAVFVVSSYSPYISFPLDLFLGLALPLHGHIGMNYVLTDYIPKVFGKAGRGPAKIVMLGITGLTMVGLTKLNIEGPGITKVTKMLWCSPESKK